VNPSLIVCPVELSAGGKSALGRALTLAQWHDAELHALYLRSGRARHTGSKDTATIPFKRGSWTLSGRSIQTGSRSRRLF
jgi:hypothetical protein